MMVSLRKNGVDFKQYDTEEACFLLLEYQNNHLHNQKNQGHG
jgi:hypothetical protein